MQYLFDKGNIHIKGSDIVIAERIRKLRDQNGFTQTELAKKLGITRSSVNAWELGISIPSTQYLVEISSIFKVSTDYLLGINETASIDVSGLSDSDIELIHSIINHLRNAKSDG